MEKIIKVIKKQLQEQINLSQKLLKQVNSLNKNAKKSKQKKSHKPKANKLETPNGLWNDFIFQTFNKTGKLHTAPKLIELARKKLEVGNLTKDQLRLGVARVLSRHESRSKKLKTYLPNGKRPAYYGLSEWFESPGKPKTPYAKKLA
jgi:hypothetical protein